MVFKQVHLQADRVLSLSPIIPVIVINKLSEVLPMANALMAGGINVLEITLRTPHALDAIHLLRQELPQAMVGAGTVTSGLQLQQCLDVGAQFAISPGATRELLDAGSNASIPLIPGVATISELMEGINAGYRYFKFFPAALAGGVNMLKAIYGPFPDVFFCPTGGINEKNFLDYLALPNVCCVGGSWVLPEELVRQGQWQQITAHCLATLETVRQQI